MILRCGNSGHGIARTSGRDESFAAHAAIARISSMRAPARVRASLRASGTSGKVASASTTPPSTSSLTELLSRSIQDPPVWSEFLGKLFACGAVTGTVLDGLHSRVGLQVYDLLPIQLGPLTTAATVPPLLGTFYVVLGLLTCMADNLMADGSSSDSKYTAAVGQRCSSRGYVALCYLVLAAALQLSASLFEAGMPPQQIFAMLAVVAGTNWWTLEGTKQGLGLAVLCAVVAPLSELVLMSSVHTWHYSQPDLAGVFVSWVPWCYFTYTAALSNLARHFWQTCRRTTTAV